MNSLPEDIKSNILDINFGTNNFIGFDKKEIEKTSNEDLVLIRSIIYSYLTNKNLKKRNINFKKAFFRINKEVEQRKKNKLKSKSKQNLDNKSVETDACSSVRSESQKVPICHFSNFFTGIQIPDFLNDICKKTKNTKIEKSYLNMTQNLSCEYQNCNFKIFSENIVKFSNQCKKDLINHFNYNAISKIEKL